MLSYLQLLLFSLLDSSHPAAVSGELFEVLEYETGLPSH